MGEGNCGKEDPNGQHARLSRRHPTSGFKGLLQEEEIQSLIERIVSRGGMVKNLHGQKNLYYQVNATYYSALGASDEKMLLARAIQMFMPGKPQVWYLDLLLVK